MRTRRAGQSSAAGRGGGYLLVEALAYIAVVFVLLGAGYLALYRCMDHSIALRHNSENLAAALQAGERWRADIRAAAQGVTREERGDGPVLVLRTAAGTVEYRQEAGCLYRRVEAGPWVKLLDQVKASKMEPDRRSTVTAWRWELELQPRAKGKDVPGRFRPLLTFLAVPQPLPTP